MIMYINFYDYNLAFYNHSINVTIKAYLGILECQFLASYCNIYSVFEKDFVQVFKRINFKKNYSMATTS